MVVSLNEAKWTGMQKSRKGNKGRWEKKEGVSL